MVSTFILHFAPDGAMAPIVYRYKAQIFKKKKISGTVITFALIVSMSKAMLQVV